jgi:B12-binding domain/radical SAM domain protein
VLSTPVFDMFPIGFISMVEYLHRFGFKVDIVNLAVKMLEDKRLDVKKFLGSLNSDVFGLDLHWLSHVQGCIEVAKLLKVLHPDSRIILGGFTATFYDEEIMSNFPFIDAVVKGDSGELSIMKYLEVCSKNFEMFDVPNLTWRNKDESVRINPITYVQESLDGLVVDYKFIASLMLKNIFNGDRSPYYAWKKYPMAATLSCKGCAYNCVTCGGSKYTYNKYFNRKRISIRSPEAVVRDISAITGYSEIPTWIIGDVRQSGSRYAHELLCRIKEAKIDSPVIFELFEPAGKDFISEVARSVSRFGFSFSPDSANDAVRRAQGRYFTNSAIEKTISSALAVSNHRFDLFFLLGLGRDTPQSVLETFSYAEELMEKFGEKGLFVYMSTLTPTLDPGAPAFDEPSGHGFHLRYRTLLDHYQGFNRPSWKYFLNYRTDAFDVDGIVNLTYQVASFMADLKLKFGALKPGEVDVVKDRIALSKTVLSQIDMIMKLDDKQEQTEKMKQIIDITQEDRGDRVTHTVSELDRCCT